MVLGARLLMLCRFAGLACVATLALAPSATAQAPTPERSLYGQPQVTDQADGSTVVGVAAQPAGVYYRLQLDPARTYRMTIDGTTTAGGRFTLRRRADDGELLYGLAPQGTETFRVTGASEFEMLFFSYLDEPASYLLRSLRIEDCTEDCGTDGTLRQEILDQTAGLQTQLDAGNDYEAAKLIMHWAAPRTTWTSAPPEPLATREHSAAELYYDDFKPRLGGVYCAGTADFFHKLLDLFGIANFELDFGDVSVFTHAVVVVPTPRDDGATDYRVLDPSFDADFTIRGSGAPASIPEMLELWRLGETDEIVVHSGSLAARPYLRNGEPTTCAEDPQFTGCSFGYFTATWDDAFAAAGYGEGLDGLLKIPRNHRSSSRPSCSACRASSRASSLDSRRRRTLSTPPAIASRRSRRSAGRTFPCPARPISLTISSPVGTATTGGRRRWRGRRSRPRLRRIDTATVRCSAAAVKRIVLAGGDDPDHLVNNTTLPATLEGGAGDDRLVGGSGRDTIDAGGGRRQDDRRRRSCGRAYVRRRRGRRDHRPDRRRRQRLRGSDHGDN